MFIEMLRRHHVVLSIFMANGDAQLPLTLTQRILVSSVLCSAVALAASIKPVCLVLLLMALYDLLSSLPLPSSCMSSPRAHRCLPASPSPPCV